jgi:hypothetical protein
MDVRNYYKRIREAEASLPAGRIVMVSLATPEGGKEGVRTEVSRGIGAKLIAEGRARVATSEETTEFHETNREARAKYEQEESARKVQVTLVPSQDFRKAKERS